MVPPAAITLTDARTKHAITTNLETISHRCTGSHPFVLPPCVVRLSPVVIHIEPHAHVAVEAIAEAETVAAHTIHSSRASAESTGISIIELLAAPCRADIPLPDDGLRQRSVQTRKYVIRLRALHRIVHIALRAHGDFRRAQHRVNKIDRRVHAAIARHVAVEWIEAVVPRVRAAAHEGSCVELDAGKYAQTLGIAVGRQLESIALYV